MKLKDKLKKEKTQVTIDEKNEIYSFKTPEYLPNIVIHGRNLLLYLKDWFLIRDSQKSHRLPISFKKTPKDNPTLSRSEITNIGQTISNVLSQMDLSSTKTYHLSNLNKSYNYFICNAPGLVDAKIECFYDLWHESLPSMSITTGLDTKNYEYITDKTGKFSKMRLNWLESYNPQKQTSLRILISSSICRLELMKDNERAVIEFVYPYQLDNYTHNPFINMVTLESAVSQIDLPNDHLLGTLYDIALSNSRYKLSDFPQIFLLQEKKTTDRKKYEITNCIILKNGELDKLVLDRGSYKVTIQGQNRIFESHKIIYQESADGHASFILKTQPKAELNNANIICETDLAIQTMDTEYRHILKYINERQNN